MKLFAYVLGMAFYLPMTVGFAIAYIAYVNSNDYVPIIGLMIFTLGVSFFIAGCSFWLVYRKLPIPDSRICTCHPDDKPPICMHLYATSDCIESYERLMSNMNRDQYEHLHELLARHQPPY